jgi:hypothetical protein
MSNIRGVKYMADKNFEILPHRLLEDLKFDVEALKKKLTEPDSTSEQLILEIESLKDSIHDLNSIFGKALEHTKEEDVFIAIKKLNERIDTVVTQNETIARGMIAISDKVEEFVKGSTPSVPAGIPPTIPAYQRPSFSRPQGAPTTPISHMSDESSRQDQFNMNAGIPPPPTASKKKRGFF